MRILVAGGTRFIGRLFVEAALGRGHEVTLLHRGASGEDLFPQAEHRHTDRDGDLGVLAGGRWDATVDISAYFSRQVRSLAAALDGRGSRYTYVSSISAYADPAGPGTVEGSPLLEPAADDVDQITAESYGRLKVSCELAAAELFTDGLLVVRPTYVVGPYDTTGRFTWWVLRMAGGGRVLAPGAPDLPIQVIDGRDMTTWMLDLVERRATGAFHAASPRPPHGFGDLLAAVGDAVAPAGTSLTWVDEAFLLDAGEDGGSLPLWPGGDPGRWANAVDPSAAYASGLAPRPLADTVRDTLAWARAADQPTRDGVGLTPARETELLARWRARG
ncbi:MAG TPA: NAD-dependent epimerase/dehydratase family protein [Actinomycetes bacterium]